MAQTDVEKLEVTLTAKTKEYERALARAQGQTVTQMRKIERVIEENNARIGRHFSRLGTTIGGNLKAGIAGAIAGLSIDKLISASIDAVKSVAEIGDLAEAIGITSVEVQNYTRLAIASGASSEAMAKGLQSIAEQSVDAESKLAKLFAANGIQIQGMATNDIIRNFSELLKNAATPADQLRIITEVLGDKVGRGLVEAFRVGADGVDRSMGEMLKSGLYHSEKQVEYIQGVETEYNKAMDRLAVNWQQLVSTLLAAGSSQTESPWIVAVLDDLSIMIANTKREMEALIGVFEYFSRARNAAETEKELVAALEKRKEIEQQIADLRAADRPPIEIDEYIDRLNVAVARVEELQARLAAIGRAANAPIDEGGTGRREPTGVAAKVTVQPPSGGSGGTGSGRGNQISEIDRQAAAVQRIIENLRFENEQMARSNVQQEINNQLRAAGVSATSAEGQAITDLVQKKFELIAADEASQAALDESLAATMARNEEIKSGLMSMAELGVSALDSIIIGGMKAEEVLAGLVKQLASAALQAMLLGQGPLAGLFGSSGGGGLFGSLIGGLMGGAAPSQRAGGGHVNAGQPYVVGEKRPELFVPDSSGSIRPKVGGGPSLVFSPVIDARGADASAIARLQAQLNDMAKNMNNTVKSIVTQEKKLNPRFAR